MSSNDASLVSEIVRYVVYMPVDNTFSPIPFKISNDATVQDLVTLLRAYPGFKKALKGEHAFLFQYGERSEPTDSGCYQRITQWLHTKSASDKMKPHYRLAKYFPEGPAPEAEDVIDIVVATNTMSHPKKAILVEEMRGYPSPSTGVKSESKIREWITEDGNVHCHWPLQNYGPPTALFHPAIARLWYRLKHLDQVMDPSGPIDDSLYIEEPSAEYFGLVRDFVRKTSDGYSTEAIFEYGVNGIIDGLVGDVADWQTPLEAYSATPDAIWKSGPIVQAIMEIKSFDGISGNASLQCLLDYAKVLTQSHYVNYMKSSNLPVVLIGIMGTRLEISTAIFTDGIYTDKLLSEDFYVDSMQGDTVFRLGYIFKALSLAIRDLRTYYDALVSATDHRPSVDHMFPDPVPCHGFSIPPLGYVGKLTHMGTPLDQTDVWMARMERPYALYRAKMTREGETVDVVVKFTVRYQEKAHRLLAANGLAPTLHCCIPVLGDMYMVVMDYVEGRTLFDLGYELAREDIDMYTKMMKRLKTAIDVLHDHNLVYGDLRSPNVIREASGNVMLIDFDWSGVHREDRYPTTWNMEGSTWAPGVNRRALMDKAHDLFMLERLEKGYYN